MKRIIQYSAVVLLPLLSSCAQFVHPPNRYSVAIDPSLDPSQVEVVLDALDQWSVATGVQFQVVYSSHKCGHELLEPSMGCISVSMKPKSFFTVNPNEVGENNEQSCGFLGTTKLGFSSNVELYAGSRYFAIDARHELGHAIGLDHIYKTAMSQYLSDSPAYITCSDMYQYHEVRGDVIIPCQ